jgi:hypothetical protein
MTLGLVVLFVALGAGLVVLGRTDHGQGRVIAGLMQVWGAGLVLAALLGLLVGPDVELAIVIAGLWFIGGTLLVVVTDIALSLQDASRHR